MILHCYGDIKLHLAHFKGQNFTVLAQCHVTCRWGVKNDYIFRIPNALLPIHRATSVGLR